LGLSSYPSVSSSFVSFLLLLLLSCSALISSSVNFPFFFWPWSEWVPPEWVFYGIFVRFSEASARVRDVALNCMFGWRRSAEAGRTEENILVP
jgi:hypothetical protein